MNIPSEALRLLLAAAIDARLKGHTWDAVGQLVKRSPETCRRWPEEYRETWNALYLEAEARVFTEIGLEARMVLHKLMRSEDERMQRDGAKFFLKVRLDQRRLEEIDRARSSGLPTALTAEQQEVLAVVQSMLNHARQRTKGRPTDDEPAHPRRPDAAGDGELPGNPGSRPTGP